MTAAYGNMTQGNVVKCAKKNKWVTNESLRLVQISTSSFYRYEAELQANMQQCKNYYYNKCDIKFLEDSFIKVMPLCQCLME